MNKINVKTLILTFSMFIAFSFFTVDIYAISLSDKSKSVWENVKITSDTKDLTSEETKDIVFKIKDNPYVSKGKIAPGCTAYATIDLNVTGLDNGIEFNMQIDNNVIKHEQIKLNALIDNKPYILGTTEIIKPKYGDTFIESEGIKNIVLELKWENNEMSNYNDTQFAMDNENIIIPVSLYVQQCLD